MMTDDLLKTGDNPSNRGRLLEGATDFQRGIGTIQRIKSLYTHEIYK